MRLRWSVAVAGTHGKTTTTSSVSTLFDAARLDPTVINGGIISSWGSNARLGAGDWMVVEADESDGSFSRLKPTVAIVTNIDPEHLDYHGSFENLEQAFANFISSIPFYGFVTLCIDHPAVQRLLPTISDRRVITYGLSTNADIRATNLSHDNGQMTFDVLVSDRLGIKAGRLRNVNFPMLGEHNVQNCLAALSVCLEMGLDTQLICAGLAQFKGVGRRFDIKGKSNGITVIDDYGHHPVEIKSALDAGRMYCGENKLIAVVQPHRYSRLKELFSDFCACFNEADHVVVADVYSAGESPLDGFEKEELTEGLRAYGHRSAHLLDTPNELAETILGFAQDGDLVMCLGAGSITQWAANLPAELDRLQSSSRSANQQDQERGL
jgi:UDP-N-acetylmuramate--alanine ligase